MRKMVFILLVAGFSNGAGAQQYAAQVTLNSGNSFVVGKLDIRGDRLYSANGQSAAAVSMIKSVEFRFSGLNLSMCDSMFRAGKYSSLESLLERNLEPVRPFSYLSSNLSDYWVWLLRVQYWSNGQSGVTNTIAQIRMGGSPAHVDVATLYFAMLLLDQDQLADAKIVFNSVADPDAVSVPMTEYLRGKIALEEGDYRQAMQHVAKIIAFHSRNVEWMPPATALEARIYQKSGQPKKAEIVANELILAYPGTKWSALGEQIKKEATGNRGG